MIRKLIFNLAGLRNDQTPKDPNNPETYDGNKSRLAVLLELGVNHADGYEYTSGDRSYLQGWRHCLLALQGKT